MCKRATDNRTKKKTAIEKTKQRNLKQFVFVFMLEINVDFFFSSILLLYCKLVIVE